jgi:hypothetical protein
LTTVPEPETPNTSAPPPRPPIDHPVRMRVTEDPSRNRLTVFFRLLLVIPHWIWLSLWGLFALVLVLANWFAVLFTGKTPASLHRFLSAYVNYATHVYAYLSVAANRYPGFTGDPGYEVDLEFDPPAPQSRWSVVFRFFLALPALMLAVVLVGFGSGGNYSSRTADSAFSSTGASFQIIGVLATAAIVTWFYALLRGRALEGTVRLSWYAIHYAAQTYAYLFILTDRYPNSDPAVLGVPRRPPPHPVTLRVPMDELERSRVTVFFRLALAVPHFVWLTLWAVLALIVAVLNWFATLFAGRSPAAFHRFLAAFIRYSAHVTAFATLVANPFPGFAGAPGSYPVDLEIAGPGPQNRLTTFFRFFLVIPALVIGSGIGAVLYVVAFLGWWASLFTGRMPRGLRNLGAFSIRYSAQVNAYWLGLLTDRYPYPGPPADAESVPEAAEPAPPGREQPSWAEPPPSTAEPTDPRGAWRDSPFLKKPEEREPPA